MKFHYHTGIDHIVIYGLSAILFINIAGLIAAQAAKQDGAIGKAGKAVGAVIPFGR